MKKIITLLSFIVLTASVVFAQADKSKATQGKQTTAKPTTQGQTKAQPEAQTERQLRPEVEHAWKKYNLASSWNDLEVAKDALYDMIVEFPNNDSLIFALGMYYYDNQKYASSALVGQALLNREPKNPRILEMVASSYEGLNLMDRALQHYESLYLATNNIHTLYKMAILQYQLKKYPESLTNLDILLSNPEADTVKLIFQDAQKKDKEYVMRVPILNLKGMVYKDQGDKVNAKKSFDEALKIAPDFLFAKQNSESLK
jgi:tetratricopeptide (TPR) repeat protein